MHYVQLTSLLPRQMTGQNQSKLFEMFNNTYIKECALKHMQANESIFEKVILWQLSLELQTFFEESSIAEEFVIRQYTKSLKTDF